MKIDASEAAVENVTHLDVMMSLLDVTHRHVDYLLQLYRVGFRV